MAHFVVRDLEEDVARRLHERGTRHGRSPEDEIRVILRAAAPEHTALAEPLGIRIVRRFAGLGLTELLPALPSQPARPATSEE